MENKLVEGIDYYIESGKFVFTEKYHLKRGSCCKNKCKNCPYGNKPTDQIRSTDSGDGKSI